jgi:hypothetical protein
LDENVTVDQFLRQGIVKQQEQILPENFNLNQVEDELLVQLNISQDEILADARNKLSKQVGLPLRGDEAVSDVVGQIINRQVNTFVNGQDEISKSLLPAGVALAIFITARSIFWFLLFPILWTAAVILTMMKRFGWIEVKEELKEVELIV